jgi:hypothetical protein
MKSMAAYTSQIKGEVQGRTYKVQNTQHALNTRNAYRGTAGCGAQNYQAIYYSTKKGCCITPKI